MNYARIKKMDISDGPGIRVALYVSGCHFHCEDCHNKEAWDFNYGEKYTFETEQKILEFLDQEYMAGLSILGGEPMEKCNEKELLSLVYKVKNKFPEKTIWLYTGYLFEDIKDRLIIPYIDIIVDGQFEKDKKIVDLKFRGSTNQRKIDVKESLLHHETVVLDFDDAIE